MGGRPRKPIELKVLQGTLDNRTIPFAPVVVPNTDIPLDPPDDLHEEFARKEWKRAAKVLFDAGLLKNPDSEAFRTYCVDYAQWRVASEEVRKKGLSIRIRGWKRRSVDERGKPVLETHEGEIIINPMMHLQLRLAEQMRKFMQEFGMTPAARSRIDLGIPHKPADQPKEKFGKFA